MNRSSLKKCFFVLPVLFFCITGRAQSIVPVILKPGIPAYEKIYIHYDRQFYFRGETVWFKAYLYADGIPSDQSHNLYLQLVDEKGTVVDEKKFPVNGATASGFFELAPTLPTGAYSVVAFTPHLLTNGDPVYRKSLYVLAGKTAEPGSAVFEKPVLRFFPESGDLVDGIATVVGFEAIGPNGLPADISGQVKDKEGAVIAPLQTFHGGMGKVSFRPQGGKSYVASFSYQGKEYTAELPVVKPSGINLKIQDEKGGKVFLLTRSKTEKEKFNELTILAEMNGHSVYEHTIRFDADMAVKGHLQTDSLPSGILRFLIMDRQGNPLAERLTFVHNREYMSAAKITVLQKGTTRRAANKIELSFSEPIQRSLSVSITDADLPVFTDEENMISRLLLTSELRGWIPDPGYYLKNTDDTTRLALDNLLLTHGWSRYQVNQPHGSRPDPYLLTFSGAVQDRKTKEPVSGGTLTLFFEAADSSEQSFFVPVDQTGKFRLDSVLFSGRGKLYYSYLSPKEKPREVSLVLLPPDAIERPAAASSAQGLQVYAPDKVRLMQAAFTRQGVPTDDPITAHVLDSVTVKTREKKPEDIVNEKYTNGFFRSWGKVVLDNINDPYRNKSQNVVNYIQQTISTLKLRTGANEAFVNSKNFSLMTGNMWEVELLINGSPARVTNARSITMDDVALIKFYEAGFPGVSSGAPGGAIAIYTKEQADRNLKKTIPAGDLDYVPVSGYSVTREFYSPDYARPDPRHAGPDARRTLYWNPSLFTDGGNQPLHLQFYNNDATKKFRIVLEGFDTKGKLIHLEQVVE